jgi:hypothetical protein
MCRDDNKRDHTRVMYGNVDIAVVNLNAPVNQSEESECVESTFDGTYARRKEMGIA